MGVAVPAPGRHIVGSLLAVAVAVWGAVPPHAAEERPIAVIEGGIIGPDSAPMAGYVAVIVEVGSNALYRSGPSGDEGSYRVEVPAEGRYRLETVVAPDGTELSVRSTPAIRIDRPGTYQVDVRFERLRDEDDRRPPGEEPPDRPWWDPAGSSVQPRDDERPKAGKPWYRTTGAIIGFVAGAAALVVVALDDSEPASPSEP